MSKHPTPRKDRYAVIIDGNDRMISIEAEINVDVLIDRQISTTRAEMVGTLAAHEAARLMALSDEALRAEFERSVPR